MQAPNSTVDEALALSVRGFKLFRLRRNTKEGFIDADWASRPLADAWSVYTAFEREPAANIGVHVGASDLVVIDCDVKHGNGEVLFRAMGELPPTFTVRTPSGGVHFYFRAGGVTYSQRPLITRKIDVRSGNGYALGPGSRYNGKAYRIECDAEPAPMPAWLLSQLTERNLAPYTTAQAVAELDTPEAVAAAYDYLTKYAPPGDQGGRNNASVPVLHKLMDFGLSPDMAAEMAGDYWPCEWTDDFTPEGLLPIAKRLAASRQKPLGIEHPSEGFVAVAAEPSAVDPFEAAVFRGGFDPVSAAAIPPRRWVAARHFVRGYMSLLIAPGGVGKTMLAMQWACAIASGSGTSATGVDFADIAVSEQTPVLVVNLEDPLDELRLRREAVISHFGIDAKALGDRVHLFSGAGFRHEGERWRVMVRRGRGEVQRTQWAESLIRYITKHNIGLVIIDPLTDAHEVDENVNPEMSRVMDTLREVVTVTHCAMLIAHHPSKPPAASTDSHAGNANSARGASSLIGAVRIAHTLYTMSEKDAEAYGVQPTDRLRYLRLDDAKTNLFLMSPTPRWFERTTVDAPNGEQLGVLVPASLEASAVDEGPALAEALTPALTAGPVSLSAAVRILRAQPMWTNETPTAVKRRLLGAFRKGETVGSVRFDPKGASGGSFSLVTS